MECNFTKQPVDQHRLINLYNLHVYIYIYVYNVSLPWSTTVGRVLDLVGAFTTR